MTGKKSSPQKTSGKTVVITGATSGIGRAAAKLFASAGYQVCGISRHAEDDGSIRGYAADVTDEEAVKETFAKIVRDCGLVDILVCCAGSGISGAIEFTRSEDARAQMEVNLFGADNCVRAVLPSMRERRAGRILLISSVAGIIPIPFQAWYSMSKSALISYAGALRNEVRPFRVKVCAILPGDIATGFTAARKKSEEGDDLYGGRIHKAVAQMEHDEQNGMPPEAVAAEILRQAEKRSPKPTVVVGAQYKGLSLLIKLLPIRFSNWLVGKLYG